MTEVPASHTGTSSSFNVPVKDLPAWGKDWLWLSSEKATPRTARRAVFHGLKGGVGRSTAIAVLDYVSARKGKNVLVLDLDLESSGVSGMLLPPSASPTYGVMDWLIEDGVGQGDLVLTHMIAESPLSRDELGSILVAPAMGNPEKEYLAKLGRAYRDLMETRAQIDFLIALTDFW